jgi:hypothetical protein
LVSGNKKVKMNEYSPEQRRGTAIRELAGLCTYDEDNGVIIKWRTPAGGQPSEADIDAKVAEYAAEWDALVWKRSRQAEYPSIQECVHAILDDDLDALQAKRASIKTKYPKGG